METETEGDSIVPVGLAFLRNFLSLIQFVPNQQLPASLNITTELRYH